MEETGCGRSTEAVMCEYNGQGFFVDVCVCTRARALVLLSVPLPKTKPPSQTPHHGCTRRQGEEPPLPASERLPAVCKCRHLPGGRAPPPLGRSWAVRLASGRCEEQMGRKFVFTYQGPVPHSRMNERGHPGPSRSPLVFQDHGKESQLGADAPALWQ